MSSRIRPGSAAPPSASTTAWTRRHDQFLDGRIEHAAKSTSRSGLG
jgi:hypothetical protein